MTQIKVIAATKEIGGETSQTLCREQTLLSGKFGGICYAREGYETIRTQTAQKAFNRAQNAAQSGHHSVFGHGILNLEINCPKIIAMLLNSIGVSNTSEKSARYTMMRPETEKEQRLYGKWHDIFVQEIGRAYPNRFTEREKDKLAYENARYMISVFSETAMVYSLPFRNLFYVMDWADGMIKTLGTLQGEFNRRLKNELSCLKEALAQTAGTEVLHDNKNEYFRFLPVQATGAYDDDNAEYYGDVYTAKFIASFAQVAQEQRHRTTRVKVNFGGDRADEFGFYLPPLLLGTDYEKEWLCDIQSVGFLYPQGTLVSVTEQGLFEDFALKCKERMCGRAQLEIMQQTERMLGRFIEAKASLSKANRRRLENMTLRGAPCARCSYGDFVCREGCTWGGREALARRI